MAGYGIYFVRLTIRGRPRSTLWVSTINQAYGSPDQQEDIIEYSAIIVAYKRIDLLQNVLLNLSRQTLPPESVVIVDNGGTLSAVDLLSFPLGHLATLVSMPHNPGYAPAVNRAGRELGGRSSATLVLTHDAQFDEHLGAGLIEALSEDPTAGASAPLLYWSSRPDAIFSAGGVLRAGGRAYHSKRPRSKGAYEVDWVDGAIVMYRTTTLDLIGWLDERYFLYFEDVDTAQTMRLHDARTLLVPSVIAHQEPGAHPLYLSIRNMTLFARKAGEGRVAQAAAVSIRVLEDSFWRLRSGNFPRLREAWRGWKDGLNGVEGKPSEHL